MIHSRTIRIAIAAVSLLGASAASAESFTTANTTPHWVWITVYDSVKSRHLDYGWVAPCRGRDWTGGSSAIRGWVRGEVKKGEDPKNPPAGSDAANIFDTDMDVRDGTLMVAISQQSDPSKYYWRKNVPYNCRTGVAPQENCCTGKSD